MPKTQREAGALVVFGLALFVLGLLVGGALMVFGLIGAAGAVVGAVIWLIHYNAAVQRSSRDHS